MSIDDSALSFDDTDLKSMSDTRRKKLTKQVKELKIKIVENTERSTAITADCDNLLAKLERIARDDKIEAPSPAYDSNPTAPLH